MSHRIKQLTQTEISVFCQQIAMVVTSGLPTYYGISILRDEAADEETSKTLTEVFRGALKNDKLEVKVENLKNEKVAAMMTLSEESRRMQDMMKMYNMYGMDPSMFGGQETLVLNANHPLVQFLGKNQESEHAAVICEQLYDLAMISHKQLSPDEMTKFVQRSNDILMMIAK